MTAISLRTIEISPVGVETDSSSGIIYLREAMTMAPCALYIRCKSSATTKVPIIKGRTIRAMNQRRRQIEAAMSNTVVLGDTTAAGDKGIGTGSAISVELGPRVIRQRSMSSCLMISTATLSLRSPRFGLSSSCPAEQARMRAAKDQT